MTVLSFHPCFVADKNRLCAGREPNDEDLAAIGRAAAVILPQGCSEALWRMASANCPRVFPNYAARFACPGKTGQICLFARIGVAHPPSVVCERAAQLPEDPACLPFGLPFFFKFDHGGEGEGVFPVDGTAAYQRLAQRAAAADREGRGGVVLQAPVPTGGRVMRVVVIGDSRRTYWRVHGNATRAVVNLTGGGTVDARSDPHLQHRAAAAVSDFCRATGINLAGFDLLFDATDPDPAPQFLEINYFFGRQGLGGSQRYYALLEAAIRGWLADQGLV
jgi:ribosomal protein S6--L-glutamate ligase